MKKFSGGYCEEATPDPIPNSEVKLLSADGTAHLLCGRVGRRRILFKKPAIQLRIAGFFRFCRTGALASVGMICRIGLG